MEKYEVIVIGAGVCGLYCAKLLKESNKKVLILESSDVIGGRIQQIEKHGRKYDIGGEYIHGGNTLLKKIIDQNNWKFENVFHDIRYVNKDAQTYVYLAFESKFEKLEELKRNDTEFKLCFELLEFDKVDKSEYGLSVLQYLVKKGLGYRLIDFVNSLYAQTQGTTLDRLNIKGAQDELEESCADHFNYRLDNSFEPLIKYLASNTEIRKNCRVNKIDYTDFEITLEYNDKGTTKKILCDNVVVTAPIPIIRNDIEFIPKLPRNHKRAFDEIGFEGGCKVMIWFTKSFWPIDFSICICSNAILSQFWKEKRHEGQKVECLVGFITGEKASRLESVDQNQLLHSVLKLYDTIFGSSENNFSPASSSYVDSVIYHWGKNEHIKGSYSHQRTSDIITLRNLPPLHHNVFFSGEAFSDDSATVEGSLQSAVLTSQLILNKKFISKL